MINAVSGSDLTGDSVQCLVQCPAVQAVEPGPDSAPADTVSGVVIRTEGR